MLEQLQASQGKKIVLELVNGRILSGTVLTVNEQFVRLGTDEGVGTIPVEAIQIIWENLKRSLTEERMEDLAAKLRDGAKAQIACTGAQFNCRSQYICRPPDVCTGFFACPGRYVPFQGGSQCPVAFTCSAVQGFYGVVGPESGEQFAGQAGQENPSAYINCTAFPGFTCARSYICRPPDNCSFTFACPGSYVPGFPSGGGACPFFACGPFQFQQPCGPFQFQQPCGPFTFGQPCGPFQFQQPCGPFTFGQPCVPFPFQQPCSPFLFGGSQCGTPGGFICPGQQFIGLAGPTTATSPEMAAATPAYPEGFTVNEEEKSKETKE